MKEKLAEGEALSSLLESALQKHMKDREQQRNANAKKRMLEKEKRLKCNKVDQG